MEEICSEARQLAPGVWPSRFLDPSLMLEDAPRLPNRIPRMRTLRGHPVWLVDRIEEDSYPQDTHEPVTIQGQKIIFDLRRKDPIRCRISSGPAYYFLDHQPRVSNTLAILTLAWAYIFSAQLFETQNLHLVYTNHQTRPNEFQGNHCTPQMADDFHRPTIRTDVEPISPIGLGPSKKETETMLTLLGQNSMGSFQWMNTAMPDEYLEHPWVKDWIGLDTLRRAMEHPARMYDSKTEPSELLLD